MRDKIHPLYLDDIMKIRGQIEALAENGNKKMLITGATGMIGSFFVDAITVYNRSATAGKIELSIMTRNAENAWERFRVADKNLDEVQILEMDIMDGFSDDQEYDYIIHLASNANPALYEKEPYETIVTNVIGAVRLSQYLRMHPSTKSVVTSSMEVYGESAKKTLREEDYGSINFNLPRAGYPESKRVAELILKGVAEEYGIRCVVARLGYIYGPTMRDTDNKIGSELIRKAKNGESVELKTPGVQRRTYCYVGDVASALLLLLLKGENGEVYNVANPESEVSIRELAELVCNMYGLPLSVQDTAVPRTNTNVVLNTTKIGHLGWKAEVPLKEGIRRSVEIWDPQ